MNLKTRLPCTLIALFIATGCAPKAVSQSDLDTPEFHYRLGVRNLDDGNYTTALQAFQRSVDLDRRFARGWGGLGLTQALMGNLDEGKRSVDEGVDRDSDDPEVFVFRGRFWTVNQGDRDWLEEAEDDFNEALDIDPNHEGAQFYLGEAYFQGLDFQRAEAQFSIVVTGQGALAGRADERWAVSQKIVRARPGTEEGKRIAIKSEVTRADLAVLFAEELRLSEIFDRLAPSTGQATFQPPGAVAAGGQTPTPADIVGHWAQPWIMEIVRLGVFEVDPSGNFQPVEPVTRVGYAMAIQRILSAVTRDPSLDTRYLGESPSRFSDVPSSHFAYSAMALSTERGIMQADLMTGRFSPGGHVSGADALLMIRELQNSLRLTF